MGGIISVDPGKSGGWARFEDSKLVEVGYGIVTPLDLFNVTCMVIEDCRLISSGKKAISSLATEIGYSMGLAVALDIPYHLIKPKVWQDFYGMKRCTKTLAKRGKCESEESYVDYKKRLLRLAESLYDFDLNLKVCDAVLLGRYYISSEPHL